MGLAEPPGSGPLYPPADLRRRGLARLCDTLLGVSPLALILVGQPVAAGLACVAFALCNDRLFGPGRSLGKRLFGLRCVVLETRQPAGLSASMKRNAAIALSLLPASSGDARSLWLSATALLVVAISETLTVVAPLQRIVNLGRLRIGDYAAGTQVIDASIALGLPVAPARRAPSSQPALGVHHRGLPEAKPASRAPLEQTPAARPGPDVLLVAVDQGPPEGNTCASL
jgi:uncharacterized RDD family membrane protein YckC